MQKIVEAMVAELSRQAKENCEHVLSLGESRPGYTQMDGDFDLEKVARAALEVLQGLPDETLDAAEHRTATRDGTYGIERYTVTSVIDSVVDAILGEQP